MGLNDHHEEEIKKFLKFARYNRQQQLRSVEGSFQDLKDSRYIHSFYPPILRGGLRFSKKFVRGVF